MNVILNEDNAITYTLINNVGEFAFVCVIKKRKKNEYISFLADINGLQYRGDGDRMTIAMTGTRKMTTVWDAFDQKYM